MSERISEDTAVSSLPAGSYVPIVDPGEASASDQNKRWVPAASAVADAAAATASSPSLTTPTANETELATQVDAVIADNAELRNQLNALLAQLRRTGGVGLLPDA